MITTAASVAVRTTWLVSDVSSVRPAGTCVVARAFTVAVIPLVVSTCPAVTLTLVSVSARSLSLVSTVIRAKTDITG